MDTEFLNAAIPYSLEAEEATLGAIMVNPAQFIEVASFLRAEDFFILRHQHIFEAMTRLHERRETIDYLIIGNELRAMNRFEDIGGAAYLTQLLNNTPMSDHAAIYARLVERAAIRRRLLSAADRIKLMALDEDMTAIQAVTEAERELLTISAEQRDVKDLDYRQLVSDYFDKLERLMQHPGEILGIPTGFKDIDNILLGLQRTDFIVFAARPGMGKTSMLVNIALQAARLKKRIGFITLEMGSEQIIQRMVSTETNINLQRLRSGDINGEEWRKFVEATGRMSEFPIFIDDSTALTPIQIRQRVQRWIHHHGLDLLIVDYLQKMSGGNGYKPDNRVQEVSYFARSLKDIAKDFNIPVLSAAQLSRAVELRQDKRPVLSDLRDSGEIEQEADVVMFLYRDDMYNPNGEHPNEAEIIIAKHRNGPTGTAYLYFDRASTRFSNASQRVIDLRQFAEVDYAGK